jgi:hypothetical protein
MNTTSQRDWQIHASLLRPCLSDLGWSSGTRSKASGKPPLGLDQDRTRFLCRFRLIHTTLGMMQKPAEGGFSWLFQEQKQRVEIPAGCRSAGLFYQLVPNLALVTFCLARAECQHGR